VLWRGSLCSQGALAYIIRFERVALRARGPAVARGPEAGPVNGPLLTVHGSNWNVRTLVFQLVCVQCPDSVTLNGSRIVKRYAEQRRVELVVSRFVQIAFRAVDCGYRDHHGMG
jgi:hypothetical protein